jgi:hypothetical protein
MLIMSSMLRALILLIAVLSLPVTAFGWDFSKHIVPIDDIVSGGPPKDGIPALINPNYVPADDAGFMRPDENVIGVSLNGVARAYPTRILSWHESVNDTFGKQPVLVSW